MATKPAPFAEEPRPPSVEVYTLGQFRIDVDGKPLRSGHKAQRKPLNLLKLLIALGGISIPVETVTDSLWPDLDGSQTQGAFSSALYRLRKLIGHEAILLADSRLTLISENCWVDCSAFGQALDLSVKAMADEAGETAWSFAEEALNLYGGPLLDGEFEFPEVLTARERLHGVFLRHIVQLGEFLSQRRQLPKAIVLYQRGLELDELAEEIYQKLMLAYHHLGRYAEGVSVYRRLQKVLQAAIGVEPSQETDAVYRALTSDERKQEAAKIEIRGRPGEREIPSATDYPVVAILPFDCFGKDAELEGFADGLVEEIISTLSKISSLPVVGRNSIFVYKGLPGKAEKVRGELGVKYVLEGSVRQSGARLRITAQLIDAGSGLHLWAESFDTTNEEVFEVQDFITKEIVTAFRLQLTDGEEANVWNRGTNNVKAWKCGVQATDKFLRFGTASNLEARKLAEAAVQCDPKYAHALGVLGFTYWWESRIGSSERYDSLILQAEDCAAKALALDSTVSFGLGLRAMVLLARRKFEDSIRVSRENVFLHPNNADVRAFHAFSLFHGGRPLDAISVMEDAMRLNPLYPLWYQTGYAQALDLAGQWEKSLDVLRAILVRDNDSVVTHLRCAAILARSDRAEAAQQSLHHVRRLAPGFSLSQVPHFLLFQDLVYMQEFTAALRKAGLPE